MMTMSKLPFHARALHHQRGITLVFALVTLLALSLAAVALIRSVDTGSIILGNLSFKQDTLLASESATRQAVEWLRANNSSLNDDRTANGYYASQRNGLDPLGHSSDATRVLIDWSSKSCSGTYQECLKPSTSQSIRSGQLSTQYVIMRLCSKAGDPTSATVSCAKPVSSTGTASSKGDQSYSTPGLPPDSVISQYYRIIVRVDGTRNSVTHTETLVHF